MMVNKTTSFKKGEGKKGNFKKNGKTVAAPTKKPKVKTQTQDLVLPLQREKSLRAELPQSNWQIKRLAMSTKIYLIYMLLMCTLLVLVGAPGYFDTGSVACN